MWKLFNFRRDKRTFCNFVKMPLIILITVPVASILIALDWFMDWSEIINDKLPRWEP